MMTTPYTQVLSTATADSEHKPPRRNSAATEVTLTDSAYDSIEKSSKFEYKKESLDDDCKTLYDVSTSGNSSNHSTTKLSKAATKIKSKLKTKKEKPKQKRSIPPNYYPNNLITFQALAESRQ
ncbi:hypothetical protein F5Y19DRAFT_439723 [Xylariaceae sp. FL1651]|nr:hypothetical protein F5Y19DRAFT_439723 [Xylariaceae sp. FL1651]